MYILLLPQKYPAAAATKSLQLCPTLCDPTDGSPPGSPVPGILQARTLEWVAIVFSAKVSKHSTNICSFDLPFKLFCANHIHSYKYLFKIFPETMKR